MTDISDCRCVACRDPVRAILPGGEGDTVEARFACEGCGKTYDQVWGVPFFVEYDESDFLSLVEIAANAGLVSPHFPQDLDHFHELLAGYHAAADRADFCEAAGPGYGPWLPVRYNEWVAVETLVTDETFAGCEVLDVGAGLGFDSFRHVRAGAKVTALEHSPVLTREGKRTLPMIRWIGGAAHAMPFADATFDAVFCNAALHHLRDIPASIGEMLRVVRPGGLLITTGDPYRADADGDEAELAIFNAHPGVLTGVNEQVPRFRDFVQTVEEHLDSLSPRLFTQVLYEHRGLTGRKTVEEFREWDFAADRAMLSRMSGSVAMKIRLDQPVNRIAPCQSAPRRLRASTVAGWLDSQAHAMARLAEWAPESSVNKPFPGRRGDKFDLLNGWQVPTGESWRQAYKRARWYLRRSGECTAIAFDLQADDEQTFDVLLNGDVVHSVTVEPRQWRSVEINLHAAPTDAPFALEIRLQSDPSSFEAGLFRAQKRRFIGEQLEGARETSDPLHTGVTRFNTGIARLKSFLRQKFEQL